LVEVPEDLILAPVIPEAETSALTLEVTSVVGPVVPTLVTPVMQISAPAVETRTAVLPDRLQLETIMLKEEIICRAPKDPVVRLRQDSRDLVQVNLVQVQQVHRGLVEVQADSRALREVHSLQEVKVIL
jgi:hypothetical protein